MSPDAFREGRLLTIKEVSELTGLAYAAAAHLVITGVHGFCIWERTRTE